MKTAIPILSFLLFFSSCKESVYEGSCGELPKYKDKLFAFIGEKISLVELPQEPYSMDAKFKATYKVIQPVCGDYNKDTIQFIVYDHYGRPAFENYKDVLLFVTNYNDTFYHEKYQFSDVYKTKTGEWATCYHYLNYRALDSTIPTKPEKIEFAKEVSYSTKWMSRQEINSKFPQPYFKIVPGKAVAEYGNYVPDLMEIKKNGVLSYLFAENRSSINVQDVPLANVADMEVPSFDTSKLIEAYKNLYNSIAARDTKKIEALSSNKVYCSICDGMDVIDYGNQLDTLSTFIDSAYQVLPNSKLWEAMGKINSFKIYATKTEDKNGEKLITYSIPIALWNTFGDEKILQAYEFEFVKINGEYKFYGVTTDNWSWQYMKQ